MLYEDYVDASLEPSDAIMSTPEAPGILQPGLQIVAYYPDNSDSKELHARVESSLVKVLGDLSIVDLVYASSQSTVIYLTFIAESPKAIDLNQILDSLTESGSGRTVVTVKVDRSQCEYLAVEERQQSK